MRKVLVVLTALLFAPLTGAAFGQNAPVPGSITGVVVDELGRPIVDADVHAFPGSVHARTDSTGHFILAKLGSDFYHVRARHLGFTSTEITTDLAKNGHVDLKFELKARPAMLDSVIIEADGKCPPVSYGGFNCRRRSGKGVYMTDDDIGDKGAIELGDIFDGVPGFRTEMRFTPYGRRPVPIATRGNRCLNAVVNGRPVSLTNPLPRYANELIAIEIYSVPSEVPPEYQRYIWMGSARQSSAIIGRATPDESCSVVVYWTSY
jgi:hypothetical protein